MTETTLYFSPQPTRSARARWALTEAGAAFTPETLDIFAGAHKTPEYLATNPLGLVPSAVIDGEVMIESSAIALWAALEHRDSALLPDSGTAGLRACLQWVVFAPAELDRLLATLNAHTRFLPPPERNAALVAETVETLNRRLTLLETALGERSHLVGDRFTVADVVIGHSVFWARIIDRLDGHPRLEAYLSRLAERPAFRAVYGETIATFPDPHA